MAGKHGVFGFDVNAALARLRAEIIGSLPPQSSKSLPLSLESLEYDRFVFAIETIQPVTPKQEGMLFVVWLLGRASQEELSPVRRLLRMRHAALGELEEVGAALREQLAVNEKAFERHMSLSTKRTEDEHDKRSHDEKTDQAAVRRTPVDLGAADLCPNVRKHELICVWPRRMLSAIDELTQGFDALDGKELFSFHELLPSAKKTRSMLLGECGAHLRGKRTKGQWQMEWPDCARLLLGDRKQHATVRNAAKRYRSENLASDLIAQRLRDRLLEVLDYPEARKSLGDARYAEALRIVREWDPSTANDAAEYSKTESSARTTKRRGGASKDAPRRVSRDVGSVSGRSRKGR